MSSCGSSGPDAQGGGRAADFVVPVYYTTGLRPQIVTPPHVRPGLRPTDDWEEFTSHAGDAGSEVIIVPDLCRWHHWRDLVAHMELYDLTPRILVTTPDPQNLRWTSGVIFQELLWLESRSRIDLGSSVDEASSRGLVLRCRRHFASAEGLDPELRAALVRACTSRAAVRSVNELASLADRDRRTISAAWTRFVGPAPAIRLKPLLDLVLLLRAVHRRHHGRRWARISRELGVSRDVLRRRAHARLGKPLSGLTIEDGIEIVRQLEALLDGQEATWPLPGDSTATRAS